MTEERYTQLLNSAEVQNELKPKLDHLRDLLNNGQASVMVGAGFSKNAEKEDGVCMADWKGLAKIFYRKVYGIEPKDDNLNPIELASKVTAKYGREYIDELLERTLPDDKIYPGKLHQELVELSWADIYTTNYDTLLERADSSVFYKLVKGEDDILQKIGPRIIKLHGSFPDTKPYVINEEDYLDYEDNHPKLVNEIRSTLIRTRLYLIGFSGDDPNFKRWLNWLKRVSKDINRVPINQFDTSGNPIAEADLIHKEYTGINVISMLNLFKNIPEYFSFIFRYLNEKQDEINLDWKISVSYDLLRKVRTFKISEGNFYDTVNETELVNLIEIYRNIRESYPGWAFLPLSQFESGFEDLFDYEISEAQQLVKRLNKDSLVDFIYEFEWRLRKAFYPISILPWFVSKCETLIKDADESDFINNEKLQTIAVALLNHYRLTFDIKSFDAISGKLASGILCSNSTELINRFRYETALQAVSQMDYERTLETLNQWHIDNDNYEGLLWKSALLIEINREEEAYKLLQQALTSLKNITMAPDVKQSFYGVFLSIINLYSPYKGKYEAPEKIKSSFEIHSYFRLLKVRLYDALQKRQDRIEIRSHGFNLLDINKTRAMDGINNRLQVKYASRIQMVWEQFGFPYRLGAMTINSQLMQLSCGTLLKSSIPMMAFTSLLRAAQPDPSRNAITKESIASLDRDFANQWIDMILERAETVEDWDDSTQFVYRLSIIILIVVSRLSAILDTDRVKRLIPFLLKIYTSQNRAYKNEYLISAFNCLPENEQGFVVQLTAECPIPESDSNNDIWIPQGVETKYVYISNKAVELVLNGLSNPNIRISNHAYERAADIYSYCNDAQKAKLDKAIKLWRIPNLSTEVNAIYSFNLVKPTEEDLIVINECIERAICGLRGKGESTKEDDGIIRFSGMVENDLSTILALSTFLSKEQTKELYSVLNQYLIQIVHSFEIEDSRLSPVFGPSKLNDMNAIARIVIKCDSSLVCPEIIDNIYASFVKIYQAGYPRYMAIEKLNQKSPILDESNLFNDIFSTNEEVRSHALKYLSSKGFSSNIKIWDEIWKKILFSSTPEIIDYIKAIISAGQYSEFVLPKNKIIVRLFENKFYEISTGFICEGDRYDIIYQLKQLAGYISKLENIPEEIVNAISGWRTGEEMDRNLPNDVILGFEEGQQIWHKHQTLLNNRNQNRLPTSN